MSSDIIKSYMEENSSLTKNCFLPKLKFKYGIISTNCKSLFDNNKSTLKNHSCINQKILDYKDYSKTNNYSKSYKRRTISPINKKEPLKSNKIQFHNELIKNYFYNKNEQTQNEISKIDSSLINYTEANLQSKPKINIMSNKMNYTKIEKSIKITPEKYKQNNLRKEKISSIINSLTSKNSPNKNLDVTSPKKNHKKLLLKDYPINKSIDPVSYIKYNLLINPTKNTLKKSRISVKKTFNKRTEYSKMLIKKGCEINNNEFLIKHMKISSCDQNNIYKLKCVNAIKESKQQPSFHFNLNKNKRFNNKYMGNCDGFYKNYILNERKNVKFNNNYLDFDDKMRNMIETYKGTMKDFGERSKEYEVLIKKISDVC